jgi:hypothetical protein
MFPCLRFVRKIFCHFLIYVDYRVQRLLLFLSITGNSIIFLGFILIKTYCNSKVPVRHIPVPGLFIISNPDGTGNL